MGLGFGWDLGLGPRGSGSGAGSRASLRAGERLDEHARVGALRSDGGRARAGADARVQPGDARVGHAPRVGVPRRGAPEPQLGRRAELQPRPVCAAGRAACGTPTPARARRRRYVQCGGPRTYGAVRRTLWSIGAARCAPYAATIFEHGRPSPKPHPSHSPYPWPHVSASASACGRLGRRVRSAGAGRVRRSRRGTRTRRPSTPSRTRRGWYCSRAPRR